MDAGTYDIQLEKSISGTLYRLAEEHLEAFKQSFGDGCTRPTVFRASSGLLGLGAARRRPVQ